MNKLSGMKNLLAPTSSGHLRLYRLGMVGKPGDGQMCNPFSSLASLVYCQHGPSCLAVVKKIVSHHEGSKE